MSNETPRTEWDEGFPRNPATKDFEEFRDTGGSQASPWVPKALCIIQNRCFMCPVVRTTLPAASDAPDLRPTQIHTSTPVFLGSAGPCETKFPQVIGTTGYDKRSPRECPESCECQTKRPEPNGTKVFQGILRPKISKNSKILEVLRHLLGSLRPCASFRRGVLCVQWCEALSLRPQMLRIFAQRKFVPQPLFS